MTRIIHEDWADYADTAAFAAAVAAGTTPWQPASVLTGLEMDAGVTYDGHKTLRYRPDVAAGPAGLIADLAAGFERSWTRIVFRPSATLYSGGEPANGIGPVPLEMAVAGTSHRASAGTWQKEAAGYLPRVGLVGGADAIEETESGDPATLADLQALGFTTWDTLVERYGDGTDPGTRVRIRAWLARVLVIDRVLRPIDEVSQWLTWELVLDAGLDDADNEIHVGLIEVWDADRHPDPYGLGYVFCDGMGDINWSPASKYEYGFGDASYLTDHTAWSNPAYLSVRTDTTTNAWAFVGKVLPEVMADVGLMLRLRPWALEGAGASKVQLVSWRPTGPSGTDRLGNNSEQASLWLEKEDATHARLRLEVDGVDIATSPGDLQLTDGLSVDQFDDLAVLFHCGAGTDGWLRVRLNGVDWWLVEDIDTDPALTGAVLSVTVGHARTAGIVGDRSYDVTDLVLTRGMDYGRVRIPWQPPNRDGTDDLLVVNTGIETQPTATYWEALFQSIDFEPDEDISEVYVTPNDPAAGDRAGVLLAPLDNAGCGGLIIGIVPTSSVKSNNTIFGDGLARHYYLLGADDWLFPNFEIRLDDPATQPYAGANGYTHHQEDILTAHPVTGAQLDPGDIEDIEFGIQVVDRSLAMTMFGAQVLRVLPVAVVPPLSGVGAPFPRKNLAYRETEALFVRKNLETRPVIKLWERRNLAWRAVPLGAGVSPLDDYCPSPPTDFTITDPLTGPDHDRRLWQTWEDPGDLVVFAAGSGGLEVSGADAPGIMTQRAYDITGASMHAEVPVVGGGTALTVMAWEGWVTDTVIFHDANNGRLYFANGGSGGSYTGIADVLYNGTAMRWWRLRHDAVLERIYAEYGSDGVGWSTLGFQGGWDEAATRTATWPYLYVRDGAGATGRFRNFQLGPVLRP